MLEHRVVVVAPAGEILDAADRANENDDIEHLLGMHQQEREAGEKDEDTERRHVERESLERRAPVEVGDDRAKSTGGTRNSAFELV